MRPQLRRSRPTYANIASTLALALALSMGGAYAHGKIGPGDIKPKAVKAKHIAPKAVTKAKLAPNACGSRVILYTYGSHEFSVSFPSARLRLPVRSSQIQNSNWQVQVVMSGNVYEVPFRLTGLDNVAHVVIYGSDFGRVDGIRVFQIIPAAKKKAGPITDLD